MAVLNARKNKYTYYKFVKGQKHFFFYRENRTDQYKAQCKCLHNIIIR